MQMPAIVRLRLAAFAVARTLAQFRVNRILLGLCALSFAIPSPGQITFPTVSEEPTVLVRRLVPRNYHDPTVDTLAFETALRQSLNRVIVVKPGETLSGVLQQQFNASATWTPKVYSPLESYVQELNGITDPAKDIKAGASLRLPDLPRGAQTPKGQVNTAVLQARITRSTAWNSKFHAFSELPTISNRVSGTSGSELQVRQIPSSRLKALALDPKATREELEASGGYQVVQGGFEAVLADAAGPVGAAAGITSKDEEALSAFMARSAATKPYLVILDDGWPAQDDFKDAARFVIEASKAIRKSFRLQEGAHGDSMDLNVLATELQNGTTFCTEDCEYPRLKSHASMIRKSLEKFRAADKFGHVQVIYLPLNRGFRYSRNILSEMVRVTHLADSVTNQLVLEKADGRTYPSGVAPGKPDYVGVESLTTLVMKPLRLGIAPAPYSGTQLTVHTDKAIVDAVVNFLILYSMVSERPHFLSMSWTAPNLSLAALFRPNGYGVWFAAAGNDPAINVHAREIQYAARSSDPGDVVAVVNTASAGCATSTLSADPELPVLGFAFPGRLDDANCGTSFSTPRVAWLLAAREAIKGKAVTPAEDESWTQWRRKQRERLMKLTRPNAPGEQRYRVSMWDLLDEPAPK